MIGVGRLTSEVLAYDPIMYTARNAYCAYNTKPYESYTDMYTWESKELGRVPAGRAAGNLTVAYLPGHTPPLRLVVVDGTWKRVKGLVRHMSRLGCEVPHVKLDPESLSYWQRRGGRSIYARRQSQGDRVCTVEAVALLLRRVLQLRRRGSAQTHRSGATAVLAAGASFARRTRLARHAWAAWAAWAM